MADRKSNERQHRSGRSRQPEQRRSRVPGAPSRSVESSAPESQVLALSRRNWILLGSGVLSVLAGFGFLAAGDTTAAPIFLLVGYLVLIPLGLAAGSFGESGGLEGE